MVSLMLWNDTACNPASIFDHSIPGAPAAMFCLNVASYTPAISPVLRSLVDHQSQVSQVIRAQISQRRQHCEYVAMQQTHEVMFCTSRRGGFLLAGADKYSSCISKVLRKDKLSGSSSLISMKAPEVIFVASLAGLVAVWGRSPAEPAADLQPALELMLYCVHTNKKYRASQCWLAFKLQCERVQTVPSRAGPGQPSSFLPKASQLGISPSQLGYER